MDAAEFKKQAEALCQWAAGNPKEGAPVFFVNGYLGHKIVYEFDRLIIMEADNGGLNYSGECITFKRDDIEEMSFDEDEYKFMIFTYEDSNYRGQGFDIEVYQLERIDFPAEAQEISGSEIKRRMDQVQKLHDNIVKADGLAVVEAILRTEGK